MDVSQAQFSVVNFARDEEVNGRIYMQFCALKDALQLSDEAKGAVLDYLLNVMSKLAALRYHYKNYARREEMRLEVLQRQVRKTKRVPAPLVEETELVFELEAFLLQTKSSLDMIVKILAPLLDLTEGSLQTYGNKGERILTLLERNVSRKKFSGVRINSLSQLISDDKDSWLSYVVDLRDTVSHYRTIRNMRFQFMTLPSGELVVLRPRTKTGEMRVLMERIHSNVLLFQQDFLSAAMQCRFFPGIVLSPAHKSEMTHKFGELGRFIKWDVGLENPPTIV